MSNHFGSFWLESCPLFAVYFAAKPPLPRRGLLRFGTCAGRVAELRKRIFKKLNRGATCIALLPLHPAEQSTSCLSKRWWCRWSILTFASTRLHRLPSIKTVLCCFIVWKPCLVWLWFHPGQKHPHPFCSVTNSSSSNAGTAYCVVTRNGVSKPCLNVFPTKISEPEASLCTSTVIHPSKHMLSSVEIMIYSWIYDNIGVYMLLGQYNCANINPASHETLSPTCKAPRNHLPGLVHTGHVTNRLQWLTARLDRSSTSILLPGLNSEKEIRNKGIAAATRSSAFEAFRAMHFWALNFLSRLQRLQFSTAINFQVGCKHSNVMMQS